MTVHELPAPATVWLSKRQAAERVNLSVATLERAMRAGLLQYAGGGGYAIRIRVEWLDEWAEHRGRRDNSG